MPFVNKEDADQPARLCRLISIFVIRCLDSIMSLVYTNKISRLQLATLAEQASLSLTWSHTSEERFSHDTAQIWTASSESGTYRLCEQRRFRRDCADAHTSSESRGTFRQKARSLAPLNGWACAVKICHDGMLEDKNLIDGAHMKTVAFTLCE